MMVARSFASVFLGEPFVVLPSLSELIVPFIATPSAA